MDNKHYFDTNQRLWDKKTDIHVNSDFYNMEAFLKGKTSLKPIELEVLPPSLQNMDLLHLQCHFGQDTLSLERMGASCTGIDFSQNAIDKASEIRDQLNLKSSFVVSNVYDIDKHLDQLYDIVFTSYGVITWLPDLDLWAEQISKRLKVGGQFIMTEFHPVLYMFDWESNKIGYRYFNSEGPYKEEEQGTYADSDADIKMTEYFWQHSLSEVIASLINQGLSIQAFKEYDYSPYDIFIDADERASGEYVFSHNEIIPPHIFTLIAKK